MARTLIGNIKGKDGRGITSINKTGTTGPVDTYTITYTDDTTSTFTVNNSDNIALQRQIVPSAAVESSATASQAYAAGDYVVVSGVLRKVTSSITKGSTIDDRNSAPTTVAGELASIGAERHLGSGTANVAGCSVRVEAYAVGKVVTVYAKSVSGYMTTSGAGTVDKSTSLTLPSGFRPRNEIFLDGYSTLEFKKSEGIRITESGAVYVHVTSGAALNQYGFDGIACTFIAGN